MGLNKAIYKGLPIGSATKAPYEFGPTEQPLFPGAPYSPTHPIRRRIIYSLIAVLLGISATFVNALVTVNVATLPGELNLYLVEASWLPAIYVAFNATANLTLIKARTQFGIPEVTQTLLKIYVLCAAVQFVLPGFATAVLIRAVDGVTAAGLLTLTIYYLLQIFPVKYRPMGLVIGVGLPQIGTPLARLVPVDVLAIDRWQGLHLIELALALGIMAVLRAAPLPPSQKIKSFDGLDLVTIVLVVSGMVLLCGAIGIGRVAWWLDTPWIGWMLIGSVPLLATAVYIEHHRTKPMIQMTWLESKDILRFTAVAILVRLALAEQTYGAVGLLTAGGLDNDQLHILFGLVALAMVAGIAVACATLSDEHIPFQVMIAALIIAAGAIIDSGATNLTRPPQLYLSQALLGFGTTLFIGPALVYGFKKMVAKGSAYLVTFFVLFGATQNVGGLAGSAFLGTYQIIQTRWHATTLAEHLSAEDPQVASRLQAGGGVISGVIVDPALRTSQGAAFLGQAMTGEATVLAYGDVSRLVAFLAILTAGVIGWPLLTYYGFKRKRHKLGAST